VQLLDNRIVIVRRDELWQPALRLKGKKEHKHSGHGKGKASLTNAVAMNAAAGEPIWRSHRAKRKKFELIELDDALSNALRVPAVIDTLRTLAAAANSVGIVASETKTNANATAAAVSSSAAPVTVTVTVAASSSAFYGNSSNIIDIPIVMATRS
jgi:hypothetical protein